MSFEPPAANDAAAMYSVYLMAGEITPFARASVCVCVRMRGRLEQQTCTIVPTRPCSNPSPHPASALASLSDMLAKSCDEIVCAPPNQCHEAGECYVDDEVRWGCSFLEAHGLFWVAARN